MCLRVKPRLRVFKMCVDAHAASVRWVTRILVRIQAYQYVNVPRIGLRKPICGSLVGRANYVTLV